MDLIQLGTSAATGGVLGLIGPALKQVFGFFERRQSNEHELKMQPFKTADAERLAQRELAAYEHEKDLMRMTMDKDRHETESELMLARQNMSADGLLASLDHDAHLQDVSPWVNDVRALVRPAITVILWLITALFFFFGGELTHQAEIIKSTLFAAMTATVWWFGDRPPAQLTKEQ